MATTSTRSHSLRGGGVLVVVLGGDAILHVLRDDEIDDLHDFFFSFDAEGADDLVEHDLLGALDAVLVDVVVVRGDLKVLEEADGVLEVNSNIIRKKIQRIGR